MAIICARHGLYEKQLHPFFFGIITTTDGDEITHMMSRENEEVKLFNKFKISEDPIVYVWLKKVEDQKRLILNNYLEKVVTKLSTIDYINKVDILVK